MCKQYNTIVKHDIHVHWYDKKAFFTKSGLYHQISNYTSHSLIKVHSVDNTMYECTMYIVSLTCLASGDLKKHITCISFYLRIHWTHKQGEGTRVKI